MLLKPEGIRQKETAPVDRKREKGEEIEGDDPGGEVVDPDRVVEGKRGIGGDIEELSGKKICNREKKGCERRVKGVGKEGDEESK